MSKLYHSKKWLSAQRARGKTIEDIASICDVSYQVVWTYLKKFGIN